MHWNRLCRRTARLGSVLVDRVVNILLQDVAPEAILCVTYTKAAAAEMKALVATIARHARSRAGADFGVFAQNALGLLDDPEYRALLTGLGKEETYYFPENEPNPRQISLLLIMIVLGLLVVALLFGLFVRAEIGIAVGVLAVLLVVFNPEFWALILRAKDRVDAGDRP